MPKGPCTFRKSDVKRASEAAASAGVKVSVEIDKSGKLKLVPLNDASEAHEIEPPAWRPRLEGAMLAHDASRIHNT
jgi:hypothetical protein